MLWEMHSSTALLANSEPLSVWTLFGGPRSAKIAERIGTISSLPGLELIQQDAGSENINNNEDVRVTIRCWKGTNQVDLNVIPWSVARNRLSRVPSALNLVELKAVGHFAMFAISIKLGGEYPFA
jgi:hypothetical protein